MAGIIVNNVTGAITVGGSGTPLVIKDDDGLTIKNNAGTNSGNLSATGGSELTMGNSLIIKRDAGLTIKSSSGGFFGQMIASGVGELLHIGTLIVASDSIQTFAGSIIATGTTEWTMGNSLIILRDAGLTIKNGGGVNSVNLSATAATTLTATGTLAVTAGLSAASITDSGLTAGLVLYTGTGGLLATDANHAWDTTNSIQTITGRLTISAGTLATTGFSAQTITATLPNTSTSETGITTTVTLNGTSSGVLQKRGHLMTLAAGSYTSAFSTVLMEMVTSAVGTGTAQNIPTASSSGPANKGLYVRADGSTVGTNIGGYFEARGGAINIGGIGKAVSTTGATSNIGLIGCANDSTTNAIGVYATLNNSADPVYARGQYALVVDNGPNVSTQHCVGVFSQNATYFTIKNLGPWVIRTDALASGVIAYDQAYSMPSSSADETCSLRTFTSAGTTSGGIKSGDKILVNTGYTGAGTLNGLYIQHDAAGTGADLRLNTAGNLPLGNIGEYISVNGSTTTGYNVGVYGSPRNGLKNYGVIGRSVVSTNATHNVGLMGSAINASTANVGVFAGLAVGDNPSLVTAALLADNGSTASPIFLARTGGTTTKFTVDATGNVLIANFGTAGTVVYNSSASGQLAATAVGAAGGVFYSTGATAPAFSAAGTSGQALLSAGAGAPAFNNLGTAAGGTGLSGATPFALNGVMYASSTSALTTLTNGTTGQVLTATTGSAPTWAAVPGGLSGLTAGRIPYTTGATTIADTGNLLWDNTNSIQTITGRLAITPGTLATSTFASNITATMAASSIDEAGTTANITSAGTTNSGVKYGEKITLLAGYTGLLTSVTAAFINSVAGGGQTPNLGGAGLPQANVGVSGEASAGTTGYNIGGYFRTAGAAAKGYGVIGKSTTTGVNFGVIGNCTGGSTNCAGYFTLGTGDDPSIVSAALLADNGVTSSPIFIARHNSGSALVTIDTSGNVLIANFATAGTIVYNSSTSGQLAQTNVGTSGQALLSTAGGAPAFGNLGTAVGGTGLSGATPFTSGGVMYASSTSALTTTALGTSSQVLIGGASPSFGSVTSSMVNSTIIVAAGTNAFTGNQDFGTNNITGVGTLSANTVQASTTNGNLTIQPNGSGTQVIVISGKTLTADTVQSTTAATDLTLTATGSNVTIASGKNFKSDTQLPTTAAATLVHKTDGGISVQAGDATEGVKWRTLHLTTTNTAAQTEMTFDGNVVSGTTNTLQLANTTTHLYVVWITARATAGTNSGKMAAWRLEYVGDGASGTAVGVGSVTKTTITVNGMTWDVTASFTSTRTQLLVTGDAATTIHWTAVAQETTVS